MPNMTFPNQRMIRIHREKPVRDFLGIKNENWQAAARNLGPHATMLYLYLASNADGYTDALSPRAIQQAIGMARSTYHDQFHKLVDKGYLVQGKGNSFDFYEVPSVGTHSSSTVSLAGQDLQTCPSNDNQESPAVQSVLTEGIEINNIQCETNNWGINKDADKAFQTNALQEKSEKEGFVF